MSETDKLGLSFKSKRAIRYHKHREAFLGQVYLTCAFLLVPGAPLLVLAAQPVRLAAAPLMIIAVITFVACSEQKALHMTAAWRYAQLEIRMLRDVVAAGKQAADFNAEIQRIAIESPPVKAVLMTCCHNEQLRAMGECELMIPVGRTQRLLRNLIDWRPDLGQLALRWG